MGSKEQEGAELKPQRSFLHHVLLISALFQVSQTLSVTVGVSPSGGWVTSTPVTEVTSTCSSAATTGTTTTSAPSSLRSSPCAASGTCSSTREAASPSPPPASDRPLLTPPPPSQPFTSADDPLPTSSCPLLEAFHHCSIPKERQHESKHWTTLSDFLWC